MKIDPISTTKPTNSDLARGFNQLHACHEDTKAKIEGIEHALGLNAGQKKVAGLSTPWKAFLRTVGATGAAMGGLLVVYRAAVAVAPGAWAFLVYVNHVILSGRF